MSIFGSWLQGQLDTRGWDQREASKRFGVGESSVHNWLHKGVRPSMTSVLRIAMALDESVEVVARQAGFTNIPVLRNKKQAANERAAVLAALPDFADVIDLVAKKPLKEQAAYIAIIRRILLDPPPGSESK